MLLRTAEGYAQIVEIECMSDLFRDRNETQQWPHNERTA